MRLALQMACTLDELCERMSPAEFNLWLAFDEEEPLAQPWLQTGVIAATVANSFRSRGRPAQVADFMPVHKAPRVQTPEEQMAIMARIAGRIKASS